MIKNENIISNFKNKDYFNQLLLKYNFWNKKINKKNTFLLCTGLTVFFVIIVLIVINLFLALIPALMISLPLITILMPDLINYNEIKKIKNINNYFVKNLKENKSILQDLAKLVVDEKSKSIFLSLTDTALIELEDCKALEKLLELLNYSPNQSNTFVHQEKRDKALKSLNIVLDLEKELPKEIQTKQKLLEML